MWRDRLPDRHYQTIGLAGVKYRRPVLSGEHIAKVIPVPIPNTVVKLCEPMIVPTSVKVGIAGSLKPLSGIPERGFFVPRSFADPVRVLSSSAPPPRTAMDCIESLHPVRSPHGSQFKPTQQTTPH